MKLEQLPEAKRKRLMDAMIKEYGQNGYRNASTNTIVKEAGISKGSLFNYVGNKTDQYLFLVEHTLQMFQQKLAEFMMGSEVPTDYFDMLLFRSHMKIRLGLEYPLEYKLLFDAYMEEAEEVKAFMAKQYALFSQSAKAKEREYLNPSVLRNPEDRDTIVDMVFHLIAGYSDTYLKQHKDDASKTIAEMLDEMTSDLKGYFEIIRKGFFK